MHIGIIITYYKSERKHKMTKTDLVNVVAAETQLSKKDVDAVVNATLNAISNALKEGDIVSVYYLPSSPSKISYAKGGYFFSIAFMVASVGCLVFGVYKVISPFVSRRKVDGNQSEN